MSEHQETEASQASPYLTDMEAFYERNPAGFSGKIMLALWIPNEVRHHMIAHVRAYLIAKSKSKKRTKRIAFRQFAKDQNIKKASTPRFNFGRHKDGTLWKQDKRTGRFARFSKSEREAISGGRTNKG